eukprot:6173314-Pleurochrysis_carterae.AAC.1
MSPNSWRNRLNAHPYGFRQLSHAILECALENPTIKEKFNNGWFPLQQSRKIINMHEDQTHNRKRPVLNVNRWRSKSVTV